MNIAFKPRLFTVDEYMTLAAKGVFEQDIGGIELHDGYIVKMSPKYLPHAGMQASLAYHIGAVLRNQSLLRCAVEPSVQLDRYNSREPDIAVYAPRTDMTTVLYPDAVRLLIEVANDSLSTDLGDKADLYAKAGVPDYWVVDLQSRVTHVHSAPSSNGYAKRSVVRFEEPLTCALLPDALMLSQID
jgi:Uma2 family endonuclease